MITLPSDTMSMDIEDASLPCVTAVARTQTAPMQIRGAPEKVTHSNGPCYNSADGLTFDRRWELETRHCIPENPKVNRIAGRFMGMVQIKDDMVIQGKREEHNEKAQGSPSQATGQRMNTQGGEAQS